jgi:Domain of unknown function (DU1801)
MAELKTKKTDVSVESFLNAVADEQQRADSFQLVKLLEETTGEKPRMWGPSIIGFGEYHYVYASGHEGDMCLTGFSPRKGNLTLYFYAGFAGHLAGLVKKLGKCKVSKGCLYVKKLEDIDLAVLREMIQANIEQLKDMSKPKAEKAMKPRKKA